MYLQEFETIKIEIKNYQNVGFFSKLLNKDVKIGESYNIHWSLLLKSSYRRNKIKVLCDGCGIIIEKEIRHINKGHFCRKCSKTGDKNPAFGKNMPKNTKNGLKKFRDKFGNPYTWGSVKEKIKKKEVWRKVSLKNKGKKRTAEQRKNQSEGIKRAIREGRFSPSNKWGTVKNRIYKNIIYQSTYELKFLKYCEEKNILDQIERGPIVQYIGLDGLEHNYFIDYKLKDTNKVFEIKSTFVYNKNKRINEIKKQAASQLYDYYLIMDNNFDKLNI